MHFDDEVREAPDPGAAARGAELGKDPERQALAAIEFDGMARTLAAKGIAFGQTRTAFVQSMAKYYDITRKAFEDTVDAQQQHNEKPVTPPAEQPAPDPAAGEG